MIIQVFIRFRIAEGVGVQTAISGITYSEFFFKTGHRVLHANFSTPC
jgi:hypothetical protein